MFCDLILEILNFPCGSGGKESACNTVNLGSAPGLGRSPGERKGYPLQYSGLKNSMNCMVHGVAKSWIRLRDFHSLTHSASLHQISRPVLELIREIGEVKIISLKCSKYSLGIFFLKLWTGNIHVTCLRFQLEPGKPICIIFLKESVVDRAMASPKHPCSNLWQL